MIRQAISCDVCGSEKQLTNHWFVASEQNGELRFAAWRPRKPLRPNSKHLCGQKCVHRLLDLFLASETEGNACPVTPPAVSRPQPRPGTAIVPVSPVNEATYRMDRTLDSSPGRTEERSAEGARDHSLDTLAEYARLVPAAQVRRTEDGRLSGREDTPDSRPEPPLDFGARFTDARWAAVAWERERELLRRAERTVAGHSSRVGHRI